ncbi:MAG: CoA transferase [Pseudomonadales bacterium]|nr:CoA transferase [Pseudomonadales bacterium]MDP6469742.1 CoA transferase [Pseudomonadales bacterium]MDP6827657.1 CoA transferase [Pseudomonadales bacterium]MDP6971903.1 CoA transferase [Pseudomonadales bacterium]
MPGALSGLRVLDLTTGPAGGLATMHLADFGAEVLLIEHPDGGTLDNLPAAPMWRRGKRTLTLDLSAENALGHFHALCAGADVLVCTWRSSALARKGLEFETLHQRHAHLIFCHISGFGSHGPLAGLPGYEHLVAAYTGRMNLFAGIVERSGPVFSALQVAVHACAQTAAAGILAALLQRAEGGTGRLVETSLLQGLLPYEQGAMLGAQFEYFATFNAILSGGASEPPMPSLYYHPAQAGDGRWMQFGNLLPHLFDNFLLVTELTDVLADPDFDTAQLMLPPEKQEAFRERMLTRIQERSADEWMAACIANGGVVATAYQTTQQALEDPDIVANGHVIERGSGRQLGPLARLTATPAAPGDSATPDDTLADLWSRTPRPAPSRDADTEAPLSGTLVIEIATIIAAPLAASFLADMGAEVIKVEQIGGDPYRGLAAGIGSARVNAGKRSISIDLKSDTGREAVRKLIASADVLIHNFRPGVPERLGIGYEQIIETNPDIIYLQCNGYGPDGPGALRPSTHPIPGAAMGGVVYQMGERVPETLQDMEDLRLWTRRLMRANEVNPDPNTAMVITTAATLALVARQRTGTGQRVLVDMFGANAQANHDDFLTYPGKSPRALPDELLLGLSPTYRLYSCADERWIFLALVTPREQRLFVETLRAADIDAPNVEVLEVGDDDTAHTLTTLFASKDAAFWQDVLTAVGLGCVRADGPLPSTFWLEDEQAAELGLTTRARHPAWGTYRRHGPLVHFDRALSDLNPPPLAGQHNEDVLTALGYDGEGVKRLAAEGTIWREDG